MPEDVFLPDLATPGRPSLRRLRERAAAIPAALGHERALPLEAEGRGLSVARRQPFEIATALALDARPVVFAEPTASLRAIEVDRLLDVVVRLARDDGASAFVSHRPEDVFAVTNRVIVPRECRVLAEDVATSTPARGDIVRRMVGRDIGAVHRRREAAPPGETVLEIRGLRSEPRVREASFAVRRGEILGGLVGAGRYGAIWGPCPRRGGTILVRGAEIAPRSPAAAVRLGTGSLPGARRARNIVPEPGLRENPMPARMGRHRGFDAGGRAGGGAGPSSGPARHQPAEPLGLDAADHHRALAADRARDPDPRRAGRGRVDIGARASICRLPRGAADAGSAVMVISLDFEGPVGAAERVVVVRTGSASPICPPPG